MSDGLVALLAGTVLTPEPSPGTVGVLTQRGIIHRLLAHRGEVPAGSPVYDLGAEAVLLPGLIDLHTHGGWGLRYTDGPEAALYDPAPAR